MDDPPSPWLVQITSVLTLLLGVFKIIKSSRVRKADAAKSGGGVSLTDTYDGKVRTAAIAVALGAIPVVQGRVCSTRRAARMR